MEKSKKKWVWKFLGIREGLTTIIMIYLCGNNTSSIEHILWASAESPGLTCPLGPQLLAWQLGGRLHEDSQSPVLSSPLPPLLIP